MQPYLRNTAIKEKKIYRTLKCEETRDTLECGSRGSRNVEENEREEMLEVRDVTTRSHDENTDRDEYEERSLTVRWHAWVDCIDR